MSVEKHSVNILSGIVMLKAKNKIISKSYAQNHPNKPIYRKVIKGLWMESNCMKMIYNEND